MKPAAVPLLALLFLGPAVSATEGAGLVAGVFTPPRAAPDFTLRGSDGTALELSAYRGRVVVLGFGFTSCPNVCPITLAVLAQARKQLGDKADGMQVVYVTVDPERDDAEQMRKYLAGFDPTFIGGTGTAEQLAAVRQAYGIIASRHAQGDGDSDSYTMAHSSFTYLIDREGRLRALMPYGHTADDYAHDVALLLAQQASGANPQP